MFVHISVTTRSLMMSYTLYLLNNTLYMQCGKRPLAKGEWKSRVASKIHFILAGLVSNSCKGSRNLKTLATITGYSFKYHSSQSVKFSVNCVIYPTFY